LKVYHISKFGIYIRIYIPVGNTVVQQSQQIALWRNICS